MAAAAPTPRSDLEAIFDAQYAPIARAIARVIRDPGRAEELAVEAFLKWRPGHTTGWLYRTGVRLALDELRRQARGERYRGFLGWLRTPPPTPEQQQSSGEEQERVRTVLGSLNRRDAELLLLRNEGLAYSEIAAALEMNPASVGTLLSRAQQTFRKEYVRRYGKP